MNNMPDRMCQFCSNNRAKYTCPRCNCTYCSVDCYRSEMHQKCSESFYEQCVTETLKGDIAGKQSKAKVIDILKRHYNQTLNEEVGEEGTLSSDSTGLDDGADEIDEFELSDGLASLNIDSMKTKDLWNALSECEKNEFKSMLKSGDIASVIPEYKPWWRMNRKLISSVDDVDKSRIPGVTSSITKLAELTKIPPSECIQYNLVNVLYSYAYILMYYNGEIHDNATEAALEILEISNNLMMNESFTCLNHAIHSSIFQLFEKKMLFVSNEHSAGIIKEVKCIIEGPCPENPLCYVTAALCDLLALCKSYKKLSKEKGTIKAKVHLTIKKIEYYISWVHEYGGCLHALVPSLEVEHKAAMENFYVQDKLKEKVDLIKEKVLKPKMPLIQEIG